MGLFDRKEGTTEHRWVEENLSAYLDGELTARDREAVERHLSTCRDCQWNLKTLGQTVRWTKELPVVPLPRVFTVPAAAQPARARRRSWSYGLLQGATALVALLLVFALAGDFLLSGALPAARPEPQVIKEMVVVETVAVQAVATEVTRQVELEAAAPAAPATEVVAEKAVSVEATPSPELYPAAPTELPPGEPLAAPAPTAVPEVSGMAAPGFGPPAEKAAERITGEAAEDQAAEEMPLGVGGGMTEAISLYLASEIVLTGAYSVEATAEPTPTPLPTAAPAPMTGPEPTATPQPTGALAPTAIAYAPPPSLLGAGEQAAGEGERVSRQPLVAWLHVAELILGGTFILLATATIVATVRRHRAR